MDKGLGQINYEAYAEVRGWRTFNGDRMPSWDEQDSTIKDGWRAGATAVVDASERADQDSLHCPTHGELFARIERTPEGRRICPRGDVWRSKGGRLVASS